MKRRLLSFRSRWMFFPWLKEKASRFGDPQFVDPAGGDFSFRHGSPALALGIESLDVSKMGRREKRLER